MKKFLVGLALALLGSSALAVESVDATTVTIDGQTHRTGYAGPLPHIGVHYVNPIGAVPPDSYDAADDHLVGSIRDQGGCGSCWTFARAAAFEAALHKAMHNDFDHVDLAEQDTLVNDHTAYGCSGGFMDGRFETQQGQTTEALCPYKASTRYRCTGAKFAKATKWAMLGSRAKAPTDDELKQAIYQYGVLAVTVAAGSTFSPDASGRITRCSATSVNHMVALSGYRPSPDGRGVEFKIRNSWGTGWGKAGYAWSKRGCNKLASTPGDAALFFYVADE